jgi:predicted alpha/beta superfamily hydrolase
MKRLFSRLLTRLGRRAARAPVTFRLTSVPANTPAGATIYLTGSCNGWTTDDPAFAFSFNPSTGNYDLTLPPGRGTLDYKFCRGTWSTIETDADNRAVPNRRYLFGQGPAVVTQQILNWEDQGGIVPPRQHSASNNVHIISPAFAMPQLRRTRRVWVYLPPGYDEASPKRYPVLYLQDGQNVFDQFTSFAGEWGVDETLDALAASGQDLSSCVVVAVDNADKHRLDEYSPWRNRRTGRGGEGEQYTDFLVHTLKPYIDHHYRTRPEREATGILGSSMGGLLATYAALRFPAVFGRVGVFSPAYWFAGHALLAYVAQQVPRPDTRWYFVCGTQESPTMAPLMTAVRDALRDAGVPAANLNFNTLADGQHAEWFWQREFKSAYSWLFGEGLPASGGASPGATTLA